MTKKSALVRNVFISILAVTAILAVAGCGGTKPEKGGSERTAKGPQTSAKPKADPVFNSINEISKFFSRKQYVGNIKNYTSNDFTNPPEFTNYLVKLNETIHTVSQISNTNSSPGKPQSITYIQLLRSEILARNSASFKDLVFQKIFNFTSWYDQGTAKSGKYNANKLTAYEKENLSRLDKIEKEGYPLDYWEEIDGAELSKIKARIDADELYRTNSQYCLSFFWPMGVGVKNEPVEWKTNFLYIGQVVNINRKTLEKELYAVQSSEARTGEKQARMDAYKEETKKVYNERLTQAQAEVKKIEQAEKQGGPLIPQGTVIYNATGRELKGKITSYADPANFGVWAPSDQYQEGQQKLYSYDATVFGAMSVVDENYVQLGTPKGSAFFNIKDGFLEYLYLAPMSCGKLSATNQFGKGILMKWKEFPDIVRIASFILQYDQEHGLSWGVDVNPKSQIYFYAIYSNLNWVYGYNYLSKRDYDLSNLTEIQNPIKKSLSRAKGELYGSLMVISNQVYLGNIVYNEKDSKFGQPVYIFISDADGLRGLANRGIWTKDLNNSIPMLKGEDTKVYEGVPSFNGNPYAYNYSRKTGSEKELWIDIYPIRSNAKLRRINVSELKLGQELTDYVQKQGIKRKMDSRPEVKAIRLLGDDREGNIYFDVKFNLDLYDFAPFIVAIDREGKLKLLLRLWNASVDKESVKDSARMGPSFYDYRAVVLPSGEIFTVWNGTKSVGVGKFNFIQ